MYHLNFPYGLITPITKRKFFKAHLQKIKKYIYRHVVGCGPFELFGLFGRTGKPGRSAAINRVINK